MRYDKEYKELEEKYIALQQEFEQYKRESVKLSFLRELCDMKDKDCHQYDSDKTSTEPVK